MATDNQDQNCIVEGKWSGELIIALILFKESELIKLSAFFSPWIIFLVIDRQKNCFSIYKNIRICRNLNIEITVLV